MINGTPPLKLFARWRQTILNRENAELEQHKQLMRLVARAANTQFGREHNFSQIRSVADFQTRVRPRRYEDMWRDYWQPHFPKLTNCTWPGRISYFALSSGTSSGTTKYIPISDAMHRANSRAARDALVHHVRNRPQTQLLGGKNFILGGSTDLTTLGPGIFAGDLSGIVANRLPLWARFYVYPPHDIALIGDWEKKIDIIARGILTQDIRTIAGTPSWLLIFFQRLFALKPDRAPVLHSFFPKLDLITHGGVNFAPYRAQFDSLLAGSHAETREVYAASEGFIAAADRAPGEGMRLVADNGLFYEFIPVEELDNANPTRHWVQNIELGVNYAIALSSCAGLFSYILGDTIKFVDRAPPRLLVTGRTSYFLSAFGEHLTGEEIEEAVAVSAAYIDAQIADFAVGAVYPTNEQQRGSHLYVVEFNGIQPRPPHTQRFLESIDRHLQGCNDDYRAHRSGGYGLDPPQMLIAESGTFAAWMKSRGKLGGQNKVPRIITDAKLFDSLRAFVTSLRNPI